MTDRLDAIRCFAAVCEAGSFSAAGRKLALTPSAVTRAVSALEQMLGVALVHRSTRAIHLTAAGESYLPLALDALERLAEAEKVAAGHAAATSGRLVVTAPIMFGRLHAARVLVRFMASHPAVRLELLLTNQRVDVIPEGVDLATRIGHLGDSNLLSRSLGSSRLVVACSPSYVAAYGRPASPAELSRHRLLAFEGVARRRSWSFRMAGGLIKPWPVHPAFFSDNVEAAIVVAEAGGGIICALGYQIAPQLASGALVALLEAFEPLPVPIQAILPPGRLVPAATRAMLDMLVEETSSWTA